MGNDETYYRLTLRFTNGETNRFILREPLDAGRLPQGARFVILRTSDGTTGEAINVLMASLSDLSYIKSERVEGKEVRQRVAGITAGMGAVDEGPESMTTIEFI